MKVLLKYGFIIESTETFSHLGEFEEKLAQFFSSVGMEAERVRTSIDDEKDKQFIMLIITKKEEILEPETSDVDRSKRILKGKEKA